MRTGEVIARRYVLRDRIAEGGMGIVFVARYDGREVAIKIARPELASNPYVQSRFRNEALALSRISHPCVVEALEHGETEHGPFLVMPRLAGEQLARAFTRETWTLARIRGVVDSLLDALDATHARGVVHGDVSSANILIERDSRRDRVMLIDFGLARLIDRTGANDLNEELLSGTPEFLAPEVIGGDPPTEASDLYGAGVVLYELLTGTTPFFGGSPEEILQRQLREPIVPPSARCPERTIPAALERLVIRMLDKDPRTRPKHAGALRDALAATATPDDDAPLAPLAVCRSWCTTSDPTLPLPVRRITAR
jgi:serine/threonine-protein kinase